MHILTASSRCSQSAYVVVKRCCKNFKYQHCSPSRQYASTATTNSNATDIAVLGGGITGLATAFYLTKSLPNANITLIEASSRLGGWLHSRKVDVGSGEVVFEQGPRTLRPTLPNGLITLDLVQDLGLEDRLLMTSKNSVSAQNRFIYYPDHLVRMPGPGISLLRNLSTLWSEPIFAGGVLGALTEFARDPRPKELQDESVGSFISRRFGSSLADNVVSAVFHGIYAGDIYNLSARTILSRLWQLEARYQSVTKGFLSSMLDEPTPILVDDLATIREYQNQPPKSKILEAVKQSSVFTFKEGIGELADRLESTIIESPKAKMKRRTLVKKITLKSEGSVPRVEATTRTLMEKQDESSIFSHVISTIPGDKLALLTGSAPAQDLWPTLGHTHAVTVMVVNLFFADPHILPVHGFGYLLPRSISLDQNPERALGVVFDSDASIGQDRIQGTKVTVMLGGHWWDGFDSYPDEDEGASMAKAVLKRHLGISAEPRAIRVGLQHDCIPQYGVGHDDRLADASRVLESWNGTLRVAGNSYTGVGLNDCVRAARDVVRGLASGMGRTGLESFVGGKKWSWAQPAQLKMPKAA